MNKSFKTIAVFFALSCFTWTNAQMKVTPSYWGKTEDPAVPAMATRIIQPNVYLNYQLNVDELKYKLQNANLKTDSNPTEILIALPHPDGQFYEYQVFLNTTMHPGLQANFPEIRSYDAIATNQSGNTVKLDITPQGFHAMILSPTESTIFIDPYSFGGGDISNYIVYYKKDFKTDKVFDCAFVSEENSINVGQEDLTPKAFGTCELRTYRLALSASGEYTAFQGGTVALAQAAQVTTMNRVNGVYERDMAITMVIIPNNNLLIYTNSATDPFTNGTPNSMITENQTAVNAAIGNSNYDIGHVFGTNSGGLAGLGVVCGTQKARGVTGSSAPVGDAFDIDYVAHEMGHQFSGNHSFNNSCSGNRNNNTAVEPGSGTTIMGYAGICAPDIQAHSDDHFHGRNLQEIGAFITGASHTCPVKTPLNNTAPSISSTAGTVTIPANTPFALTAIATDNDGNTLTYCWEQINNEISTQAPVASSTGGPNFRSITPSTSPTRYFPAIASQMSNGPFTWEVIPSVSRTMNFRVTVRDNAVGGGCNDHDDVTVTTTSTAGPFIVNYPSLTGISWSVGDTRTVTWSVANTNVAPVACANVNIMLSVDGGVTFTTILSNTPNDGSQDVTVPNSVTTTAIIMVICENGTFFDISNNFFEITTGVSCNAPSLPVLAGNNTMCLGGSATLTITGGSLNDATNWHWYTGNCGGTPIGTGISITASSPGIYYVRGEGGCVTPGNCSTVNLQIQTIVNTVVVSGMQMTANQSSATYQWIDCKNGNALITGATAQSYVAPNDGEYAVIITRNGCTDTSNCITISNAGTEDLNLVNVQLYPNPVASILTVDFGQPINLDVIELTDALGRIIQTFKNFNGNQIQIDLAKESDGVYFLNLNYDQNSKTLRIIKQ